jgi:hypothetical protein
VLVGKRPIIEANHVHGRMLGKNGIGAVRACRLSSAAGAGLAS